MKLKDGFLLQQVGDSGMALSPTWQGLIKNNEPAQYICQLLLTDTTEEAIVEAMFARYDAPREVLAADVREILAKLRAAELLDV